MPAARPASGAVAGAGGRAPGRPHAGTSSMVHHGSSSAERLRQADAYVVVYLRPSGSGWPISKTIPRSSALTGGPSQAPGCRGGMPTGPAQQDHRRQSRGLHRARPADRREACQISANRWTTADRIVRSANCRLRHDPRFARGMDRRLLLRRRARPAVRAGQGCERPTTPSRTGTSGGTAPSLRGHLHQLIEEHGLAAHHDNHAE